MVLFSIAPASWLHARVTINNIPQIRFGVVERGFAIAGEVEYPRGRGVRRYDSTMLYMAWVAGDSQAYEEDRTQAACSPRAHLQEPGSGRWSTVSSQPGSDIAAQCYIF